MQKAVDLDRAQAGRSQRNADQPQLPNPNGTTNYLNKVLTQNKVDIAEERYWEVQAPLQQASQTLWCSTRIYPCFMGHGK